MAKRPRRRPPEIKNDWRATGIVAVLFLAFGLLVYLVYALPTTVDGNVPERLDPANVPGMTKSH